MRTLKVTVAYDGTGYAGWQRQNGAPTIQALLEAAFNEIEGRAVTVRGAARTDAGVHALGQVASARLTHSIDNAALARALNAKLPDDIRILRVDAVADDFHAQYAARSKAYQYRLSLGPVANPLERGHVWHVRQPLDLGKMQRAGAVLCGRHDFAAFQTAAGDMATTSTVRTIAELEVGRRPGPAWLGTSTCQIMTVDVVGDGFLRHMVRAIVGTLVEVGAGRFEAADVAAVLSSGRRERAGPTAPPHGLFLVRVDY